MLRRTLFVGIVTLVFMMGAMHDGECASCPASHNTSGFMTNGGQWCCLNAKKQGVIIDDTLTACSR